MFLVVAIFETPGQREPAAFGPFKTREQAEKRFRDAYDGADNVEAFVIDTRNLQPIRPKRRVLDLSESS